MYTRDQTKTIFVGGVGGVGGVPVGGGHPITIQSMTNTDTRDALATTHQILALAEAGCEIIRVAVPDMKAAHAIRDIKKSVREFSNIPIVADIHFDYRLALAAVESGADKLRINPGNITDPSKVRMVADAAKAANIPIRVGVNGGSLEKNLIKKHGGITPNALVESVLTHVKMLENHDFHNIVLAIKVSDIPLTLAAHKKLCEHLDYPLHIGITEAGTPYKGTIKSAAGIGALLAMGIGDTVRVSLTGDPLEEVRVAKEILQAFGLRKFGAQVISCPTCGRCEVDLAGMAREVEAFCDTITTPITVAVMGCVVNGPGEASQADFGIACGKGQGVIFQKGQIIEKVPEGRLAEVLISRIRGSVG